MDSVCRLIRIIMILQLTLIKSELDLIIKLSLSYNPKHLKETKTTSGHNYLFGTGLRVETQFLKYWVFCSKCLDMKNLVFQNF